MPDDKIKEFAVGYHKYFDELINLEKERVEKGITFRKKEYEIIRK